MHSLCQLQHLFYFCSGVWEGPQGEPGLLATCGAHAVRRVPACAPTALQCTTHATGTQSPLRVFPSCTRRTRIGQWLAQWQPQQLLTECMAHFGQRGSQGHALRAACCQWGSGVVTHLHSQWEHSAGGTHIPAPSHTRICTVHTPAHLGAPAHLGTSAHTCTSGHICTLRFGKQDPAPFPTN